MRRPWDGVDIIHRPTTVKIKVAPSDPASLLKSAEVRALLLVTEMMCLFQELSLENRSKIHGKLKGTAHTLRLILEKEKARIQASEGMSPESAGKGLAHWLFLLREFSQDLGKGTDLERRTRLAKIDSVLVDTFEHLGS